MSESIATLQRVGAAGTGPPWSEFPRLVAAGPLWFSSEIRGAAVSTSADPTTQCRAVYETMRGGWESVGLTMAHVVRVDHFVSSQRWLATRQAIRAEYFGRPAPIASTGIAMSLPAEEHLIASSIAVAVASDKQVLVDGAPFSMPAIAAAVRAGPLVFFSGVLQRATNGSAPMCTDIHARALEDIEAIRSRCDRDLALTRLDLYASQALDARAIASTLHVRFGDRPAISEMLTPFDRERAVEATAVFAEVPQGEHEPGQRFVFVRALGSEARCEESLAVALARLGLELAARRSGSAQIARLDLVVPHAADLRPALQQIATHFGADRPAIVTKIAGTQGTHGVALSAIAVGAAR